MKRQYFALLSQMLATYKSQRPFFTVRKGRASLALLGVLRRLGLVQRLVEVDFPQRQRTLFRVPRSRRGDYLAVWLRYADEGADEGRSATLPTLGREDRPYTLGNNAPFARLVLSRRPSRLNYSAKLSREAMFVNHRPFATVVHVLETPQGLMTSWEAKRRGTAGYILCTLYL